MYNSHRNIFFFVLAAAGIFSGVTATADEPSNLYNPDYLPAGVREQLEAARDGKSSSQRQATQRQVYDQIFDNSQEQPRPSAPQSNSTLDALDKATRLLEVLQQTRQQQQNVAPREEYRQAPPANYNSPQYRAPAPAGYNYQPTPPPANSGYRPAPVDTSYRQDPQYRPPPSASRAPAAVQPAARPAPPAAPACPSGTEKNPEMAALGLASCCDSAGQCF